jgi:hypothetical protein
MSNCTCYPGFPHPPEVLCASCFAAKHDSAVTHLKSVTKETMINKLRNMVRKGFDLTAWESSFPISKNFALEIMLIDGTVNVELTVTHNGWREDPKPETHGYPIKSYLGGIGFGLCEFYTTTIDRNLGCHVGKNLLSDFAFLSGL